MIKSIYSFSSVTTLILIVLGFLIFSCTRQIDITPIEKEIGETQKEYVSDKRVKRFIVNPILKGDHIILKGETNLPQAKSDLLEKLKSSHLTIVDSIQTLPHPDLKGAHFGIVRISVCNIRYEPKHWAELSTQALLGTELRVHKKEGDWYLVQTPDDYFGWLDAGGFTLMTKAELDAWKKIPKVVFTEHYGFASQNEEGEGALVSDLVVGNILGLDSEVGSDYKVLFPDGREALISKTSAVPLEDWLATHQPNPNNIIETAKEFLGRPYLWGGTSGKGMDCSGYTKTVYYLHGIQLERDASLQVHTGIEIETDTATWKNLEPGDLLFFGRSPEEKDKIRHVAIWMGDGKIIHATELVKIESLIRGEPDFAEWRLLTFARAKRILSSEGKNGIKMLAELPYY